MLSGADLDALMQRLGLSTEAQEVVAAIRSSPPSRAVTGRAGTVCVRYPSRNIGVTIQAERHRVELAAIYLMEHDPAVLEYDDQPPPLTLTYRSPTDRTVTVRHTPDFFVIRTDGIVWEEWKHADALPALATRMPNRSVQDADGVWRCPPGEEAVAPFGGRYRVRTSAEIDWILQRNLRFLEDYLRNDCPVVPADLTASLREQIPTTRDGTTLATLLTSLPADSVDALYTLIATGQIALDLSAAPLAEPERVVFHSLEPSADPRLLPTVGVLPPLGSQVQWDSVSWLVINLGVTTVALLSEVGTCIALDHATIIELRTVGTMTWPASPDGAAGSPIPGHTASPQAWQEAYRRYRMLAPVLQGTAPDTGAVSSRTVRRWVLRYRAAERDLGCGYLGLLPDRHRQGNHATRLDPAVQTLLDAVITTHYERPQRSSMYASYTIFRQRCQEQGLPAPSYPTFTAAIRQRPRTEQLRKRQGKRAAYQQQPFSWELTAQTPRHGDRPFATHSR